MSKFRKATNNIVFEPVAGYTIQIAIKEAIEMAAEKHQIVRLEMNDIVLNVTEGSTVPEVKALYLKLLNQKYKNLKQNGEKHV